MRRPVMFGGHADDSLRTSMLDRWATPERRTWRIEYRSINGLDSASWHIAETMWWVRFCHSALPLDELDPQAAYEIDAVALAQNYGVIEFFVYGIPTRIE